MCELCRRSFLSGLAAIGTAGFMPKAFAQGAIDARFERPNVTLPARGEFVITNATVITMDPQLGDILNGSVHVNDGAIVAVGANVSAPGATAIDAQGRVVMPALSIRTSICGTHCSAACPGTSARTASSRQ